MYRYGAKGVGAKRSKVKCSPRIVKKKNVNHNETTFEAFVFSLLRRFVVVQSFFISAFFNLLLLCRIRLYPRSVFLGSLLVSGVDPEGDGAVVGERDFHVGAEAAGGDWDALPC